MDISLPLIIIIMPGEFQFTYVTCPQFLTQLNKNFKKLGCLQNLAQIFKHSLDQAHEQQNAVVKGKGGIIGLTESPVALQCWLICGRELDVSPNFKAKWNMGRLSPQIFFIMNKQQVNCLVDVISDLVIP